MYITIIDQNLTNPAVDIIEVPEDFLNGELGEYAISDGRADSTNEWDEVPEEEKIDIFMFDYCGYNPGNCNWMITDENPTIQRLTTKDFR